MGYAQDLYARLRTEADVIALAKDDVEAQHLDFKEVPSGTQGDKFLKETVATALSGYANAEGGILVFGVRDKPRGPKPIEDLRSRLEKTVRFLSEQVSFAVPGADAKSIASDQGDDLGYLVLLVPASDLGPHMANDGCYYRRAGESFLRMRHREVADMFGRRPHPDLQLVVRLEASRRGQSGVVMLRNRGRGLARFPLLSVTIRSSSDIRFLRGGSPASGPQFGLPVEHNQDRFMEFRGGVNDVIHPGADRIVVQLYFPNETPMAFVLAATIAADGIAAHRQELVVEEAGLRAANQALYRDDDQQQPHFDLIADRPQP